MIVHEAKLGHKASHSFRFRIVGGAEPLCLDIAVSAPASPSHSTVVPLNHHHALCHPFSVCFMCASCTCLTSQHGNHLLCTSFCTVVHTAPLPHAVGGFVFVCVISVLFSSTVIQPSLTPHTFRLCVHRGMSWVSQWRVGDGLVLLLLR